MSNVQFKAERIFNPIAQNDNYRKFTEAAIADVMSKQDGIVNIQLAHGYRYESTEGPNLVQIVDPETYDTVFFKFGKTDNPTENEPFDFYDFEAARLNVIRLNLNNSRDLRLYRHLLFCDSFAGSYWCSTDPKDPGQKLSLFKRTGLKLSNKEKNVRMEYVKQDPSLRANIENQREQMRLQQIIFSLNTEELRSILNTNEGTHDELVQRALGGVKNGAITSAVISGKKISAEQALARKPKETPKVASKKTSRSSRSRSRQEEPVGE
jgi:hypothetical protein